MVGVNNLIIIIFTIIIRILKLALIFLTVLRRRISVCTVRIFYYFLFWTVCQPVTDDDLIIMIIIIDLILCPVRMSQ